MRIATWLSRASAGMLAIGAAASAHHSFNMYDYDLDQKFSGTIADFTWSNPHGLILVMVARPGGGTSRWNVELSSPNILGRRGWNSRSLHRGEKIDLVVHPMRDGRPICLLVSVTTPDGRILIDSAGAQRKDE